MSRGLERPPVWFWPLAVVAVVLLAVGIPYAVSRSGPDDSTVAATPRPSTAEAVEEPAPVVAFLGDSFTAGVGATDPTRSYASLSSNELGWSPVLLGQGGTGYVNPGDDPSESAYPDRVAEVVAASPAIVVVQGSGNDYASSAADVAAAASETYAALKQGLPTARIYVVGPVFSPDSDPRLIPNIVAGLTEATSAAGVTFIDPVADGWLGGDPTLFSDGIHPNDQGHEQMADLLATAIRAAP